MYIISVVQLSAELESQREDLKSKHKQEMVHTLHVCVCVLCVCVVCVVCVVYVCTISCHNLNQRFY